MPRAPRDLPIVSLGVGVVLIMISSAVAIYFTAVDMTVAAINRVNIQGTTEQQAQQIRSVMATVFPEAVTLVREARQGLA